MCNYLLAVTKYIKIRRMKRMKKVKVMTLNCILYIYF